EDRGGFGAAPGGADALPMEEKNDGGGNAGADTKEKGHYPQGSRHDDSRANGMANATRRTRSRRPHACPQEHGHGRSTPTASPAAAALRSDEKRAKRSKLPRQES